MVSLVELQETLFVEDSSEDFLDVIIVNRIRLSHETSDLVPLNTSRTRSFLLGTKSTFFTVHVKTVTVVWVCHIGLLVIPAGVILGGHRRSN